ncbi:photosystem I reaction center subunit V, chloroplastic-like [Macadamia integrifolia]|uniref:photosystem I reaction center subunit V, chloroplastic-like n=1 Tax=Macadamia integrifolia TaxID=60698 RepID=UPI001C4E9A91|nr:photosystem I reaction center subunit V, chloroplastic-like [Macadamia integrifolia]
MASTTLFSTLAPSSFVQKHHHHNHVPSHQYFQGLRPIKTTDASLLGLSKKEATAQPSSSSLASSSGRKSSKSYKRGICRAELNPSLVISLSTGLSLFLGRFVFFNFQRENVAKQGLPEQNGMTHFEAGDTRAKEYVSLLKSNDPVGFNIVDVLSWGSIGHIVAYYILATSSNGYDPKFFD